MKLLVTFRIKRRSWEGVMYGSIHAVRELEQ